MKLSGFMSLLVVCFMMVSVPFKASTKDFTASSGQNYRYVQPQEIESQDEEEAMRWFVQMGHQSSFKLDNQEAPFLTSFGWVSAHYTPSFRFLQNFRISFGDKLVKKLNWIAFLEYRVFGNNKSGIYLQTGMGPQVWFKNANFDILAALKAEGRLHMGKNIQLLGGVEYGIQEPLIGSTPRDQWVMVTAGFSFVF